MLQQQKQNRQIVMENQIWQLMYYKYTILSMYK